MRQCGKSRDSVCKTWDSLKAYKVDVVSMYTLISSTLYLMDISRRSLKKHLHFKEEKAKKVKIQRQIYMSSLTYVAVN